MKSIARSLILYFLVLLAVALGSVSVLAYRSIEKILAKEQDAQRQLLHTQYENKIHTECSRLDRLLRMQAIALGQRAQFQFGRSDLSLLPLSLLSAGLDPWKGTCVMSRP